MIDPENRFRFFGDLALQHQLAVFGRIMPFSCGSVAALVEPVGTSD
jgi:hypothetical protein